MSEEHLETCKKCSQQWSPSLIESSVCIFCINKSLTEQLEKAKQSDLDVRQILEVTSEENQLLHNQIHLAHAQIAVILEELDSIGRASYNGENFKRHFREIFMRCELMKQSLNSPAEAQRLVDENKRMREELELERKITIAACTEVSERSDYDALTLRGQYMKVILSTTQQPNKTEE